MALFKISKGTKSNLDNQTLTEGYCWFTPEDGKFYIDAFKNEVLTRIPLNAAVADSVAWTNVTGRPGNATSTKGGILTDAQAVKLAGIATGAEVNQNAFSNIKIGSTTVAADAKTDTVEFTGSNITISGDATNDKVTFSLTKANVTTALGYTPPTTNTTYDVATQSASGLMSSDDKTKLNGIATGAEVNQNAFSNIQVGSTTVAADAKTDTVEFVGSNVTITPDATNDKVTFSLTSSNVTTALGYTPPQQDTTYSAATQSAAGLMSAADKKKLDGVATGAQVNVLESVTASGTAPLTLTAGTITNKSIAISGAIADATTSAKGVVKIGDGISVNNGVISVTASGLGLSSAMLFKGSLGTGGTITSLPAAAAGNTGYTYKVITAGTYASQAAKVGDVFVSDGSNWILIPSGDEPSGTVTSVGVSNATNGGLTVTSSPITTSGTISIGHTNVLTNAQTTQALYPIKIDKNGHISAYGTAVTSLPASDVSAWAKAATKPTYNWGEISQSGANNIEEGTSDFSDNTEIFSSYASNNGFADTNALGKVYRRDAVHMYNYIKSKLAVTNNNINLSRNTETTIATIGGTAIKIKLPASDNTDTKQNITLATTSKAYLTGVTTTPTSNAQALTGVADTGVYLTATAGEISAVRHSFNISGTEKAYMVFNSTTNAIDFIFN